MLLTAQIRYEHNIITLRAISYYTLCVTCNIRYEYALAVQRLDVSNEHALGVGGKERENMEETRLCHFCSGTCCGLPSIDSLLSGGLTILICSEASMLSASIQKMELIFLSSYQ